MSKNMMIAAIIVVVLIVGGLFLSSQQSKPVPVPEKVEETVETVVTEVQEKAEDVEEAMAKDSVEIKDFAFSPKELTVKVGSTVTWTNKDLTGHSATSDDKSFDTGVLSQGESATVTFDKAETFNYHCTPHPNMKATIIVVE
mgnify:CR=1 FL=1